MNKSKISLIKVILTIMGVIVILTSFVACDSTKKQEDKKETTSSYKILDYEGTAKAMAESNTVLLDVRTQEEYDELHIKNAKLIPLDQLKNKVVSEIPDKNTKILIYCRSGNRSKTATNQLLELGYINVYDIGGISSYKGEVVNSK